MTVELKLSNPELAWNLTYRDLNEVKKDGGIQAQIEKLSPTERQIVELYLKTRESTSKEVADRNIKAFESFVQLALSQGKAPGYATPDPLEKLKSNPEYTKINEELKFLNQEFYFNGTPYKLADLIKMVDGDNINAGDGVIWQKDILYSAGAGGRFPFGIPEEAKFAAGILQNPRIKAELVKLTGDFQNGAISISSLEQRIATLEKKKADLEAEARGASKSQQSATSSQSNAASGAGPQTGVDAPKNPVGGKEIEKKPAPASDTDTLVKQPIKMDMGEVTGGDPLTRSTERITNALGSIEEQIDQVIAQMGKEEDPKKLKELEGRLMKLERLQSTMSKMLERLQNMIQNLAAMYHKLQMSAIQNIR